MDERAALPWRGEEEHVSSMSLSERSELLRRSLISETVDIGMAVMLGMGEEYTELLIDGTWNSTRALALNPDTVDIVLDCLFQALAADAGLEFYELRKKIGERRHGLEAQ